MADEYQVQWIVNTCERTLLDKYFKGTEIAKLEDPVDMLLKFVHMAELYNLKDLDLAAVEYLSRCKMVQERKIEKYERFNTLSDKKKYDVLVKRVETLEKRIQKQRGVFSDVLK